MPNSITVYRIVESEFANLVASGKANRWNFKKNFVLYTAQSKSLATLENLCRLSGLPIKNYVCLEITIDLSVATIQKVHLDDLPKDWQTLNGMYACQQIGQTWYQKQNDLILKVPSVVVPDEYNFLLHTEHPQFKQAVQIKNLTPYLFDQRLF